MTSTEACHAKLTERLLNAPEYARKAKVADEKRRDLLGKLGACAIADVSSRDTVSDLPVICQACGVRRSDRTSGGCRRLICTPCRLDDRLCLACDWEAERSRLGDQTCDEAVMQKCTAETYDEAVMQKCTAETYEGAVMQVRTDKTSMPGGKI